MNPKKVKRLFDILPYQLITNPLNDALVTKKNGYWEKISTKNYIDLSNIVSCALLKLKVKKGDHIIIISSTNRSEWNILDIAIQQIGAISVPIYSINSDEDNKYIFKETETVYCFVSNLLLYKKIQKIKNNINSLQGIYCFDKISGIPNWYDILKLGQDEYLQKKLEKIKLTIQVHDIVTVIYTSGTTGTPKGVMLSHHNLISNILASSKILIGTNIKKALSFLPCCHSFERIALYIYQYIGISIYFSENIETIEKNAKEIQPDIITTVPRFLEKIYDKIYLHGTRGSFLNKILFKLSIKFINQFKLNKLNNLQYQFVDIIIFKKLRNFFGGKIQIIISAGATLSPQLNKIFHIAKLPIIEGYGLTETSPIITINGLHPPDFRIGSVGKPLEGINLKIAEDGEICVKGPNIMKGYFKNLKKTKEMFDSEGYFLTGDIGVLNDGFLSIIDRKKEIFKISNGKYIAPQMLENQFKKSHFIEQIMIVGEGEKMPCAFIQPNFSFIRLWLSKKNILVPSSNEILISLSEIIKRIDKEIKIYNQVLYKWEQIKKFSLTPEIWSIESGHLTPTLKLRRKIIQKKYDFLYKKMYKKM